MRPQGTAQSLERRRLQAVLLLKAGTPYRDVARMVGASLSSVVRWQQSFRRQGKRGLRVKPSPGRPSLLSDRQKQKLTRLLLEGPLEAGYTTNLWTLRRIRDVIRREFAVSYTIPNVWRFMREMGWCCQKPSQRDRERNEKAIRYWKQHVWPRIKKNSATWSPLGLP